MSFKINNDNCMSTKNKTDLFTQCPHKKKFGDFCGIHHNRQNVVRIDSIYNSNNNTAVVNTNTTLATNVSNTNNSNSDANSNSGLIDVGVEIKDNDNGKDTTNSSKEKEKEKEKDKENDKDKVLRIQPKIRLPSPNDFVRPIKVRNSYGDEITLYHRKDLMFLRKLQELHILSDSCLDSSIISDVNQVSNEQIDWNRVFYTCMYYRIDIKGIPNDFLNDLISYLETYVIDEKIGKNNVKSYGGPGLLKYRGLPDTEVIALDKLCANETDFHEMTELDMIPDIFLFIFTEKEIYYGCDIRSLREFFTKTGKKKNPYTNLPLSESAIALYNKRLFLLERNHISLRLQQDEISQDKKYELDVLDIFQIMYSFGYPVDHQWYLNLDFLRKKRFYYCLEELWNYRLTLTKEQKLNVVPYKIFTKDENDSIAILEEPELDTLLLKRMKSLVSAGKTKEDCISGSMYILMGLIQVSGAAAEALPQLNYAIN